MGLAIGPSRLSALHCGDFFASGPYFRARKGAFATLIQTAFAAFFRTTSSH